MINTKHYREAHPHVPSHNSTGPDIVWGRNLVRRELPFSTETEGNIEEKKIDSASGSDKSWRHERWMELRKSWDENNGKSASTSIHFDSMRVLHASSIPHLAISSSNLIHFLCSLAPFFHPRFTRCRMKANWIVSFNISRAVKKRNKLSERKGREIVVERIETISDCYLSLCCFGCCRGLWALLCEPLFFGCHCRELSPWSLMQLHQLDEALTTILKFKHFLSIKLWQFNLKTQMHIDLRSHKLCGSNLEKFANHFVAAQQNV